MDRIDSHTIRALGRFAANLCAQFVKRRIDFVLEQSGTRARTALADITAIDKNTIHASFHQLIR